jgi:hypothetical protein
VDWKLAAKNLERQTVLLNLHPLKPDRGHIDLSNEAAASHWSKRFGRTKEEIAAAIAKVGNNPDTVAKELGSRADLP